MMCRINSGAIKKTLFASMSAVGTLFDCSFTKDTGFSGNGKCSLCTNETLSRPSALQASRNQTVSSAARVIATCSASLSLSLAVYAQPPCTFTAPEPCPAEASLAITNAAAAAKNNAAPHFELMNLAFSGLLLVLEPIGDQPNRGAKAGTTSAIPETNNRRSTTLRKLASSKCP